MSIVIVPDFIDREINRRLDEAFAKFPDAEVDRKIFYATLAAYFDEHGIVPDFNITPNEDI